MSREGPSIDVMAVARLARLSLAPEEAARLGEQLQAIVGYVAQLAEVDVEGVAPMTHAADLTLGRTSSAVEARSSASSGATTTLRPDEPKTPLGAEQGLSGAPEREGPLVVVPRIIGEAP